MCIYPSCCRWHYFVPFFYGRVVFHYTCMCVCIHTYICKFSLSMLPTLTFKWLPSPPYFNSATMNIGVYVYFQIMVLSRYMPRSGIAGSYDNSIITFLRNFHTVPHNGFNLITFPFLLHSLQHLLFVDFLIMAILTGIRWYSLLFWFVFL